MLELAYDFDRINGQGFVVYGGRKNIFFTIILNFFVLEYFSLMGMMTCFLFGSTCLMSILFIGVTGGESVNFTETSWHVFFGTALTHTEG